MDSGASGQGGFPATRWSMVAAAGERAGAALEELCRSYWRPLYAYARRRGHQAADAEDLIQDFFCHLLDSDTVARARRERGRFRSFLLTALRHFLADAHAHATAAKRDRRRLLWLDGLEAEARYRLEPAGTDEAELLFDRAWALTVLEGTLLALEGECAARGQARLFACCRPLLTSPADGASLTELATELALTPGSAKVALHRLRRRWRDLLRQRVADTVADAAEVEDELRHLISVVGTIPR